MINVAENYPTLYENKWTTPDDYAGFNPVGDYVLYSRTRDSGLLSEVNFRELENEFDEDAYQNDFVYGFRASHWACGWVDYLMISKKAPENIINEANELLNALADYPVVNEVAYSEAEYDAIVEYWDNLTDDKKKEYSTDSDSIGDIPEHAYESIREIINQ
tara:strand:- start:1333 stop:1815 length:483 start_codon:yes stop_codon:yes gene_type:complete